MHWMSAHFLYLLPTNIFMEAIFSQLLFMMMTRTNEAWKMCTIFVSPTSTTTERNTLLLLLYTRTTQAKCQIGNTIPNEARLSPWSAEMYRTNTFLQHNKMTYFPSAHETGRCVRLTPCFTLIFRLCVYEKCYSHYRIQNKSMYITMRSHKLLSHWI